MADNADEKDKINIFLAEYRNQSDWQRHNETQRAQLTNTLLVTSAALVAFLPKDRPLTYSDWPIPTFLIILGILGIMVVMKYWERFLFHARIEDAHRIILDSYFPNNLLIKTREDTIKRHNKECQPLFKDKNLKQHWLWIGVFTLIILLGIIFLARAFSSRVP
jgi:hypothetical protein